MLYYSVVTYCPAENQILYRPIDLKGRVFLSLLHRNVHISDSYEQSANFQKKKNAPSGTDSDVASSRHAVMTKAGSAEKTNLEDF